MSRSPQTIRAVCQFLRRDLPEDTLPVVALAAHVYSTSKRLYILVFHHTIESRRGRSARLRWKGSLCLLQPCRGCNSDRGGNLL